MVPGYPAGHHGGTTEHMVAAWRTVALLLFLTVVACNEIQEAQKARELQEQALQIQEAEKARELQEQAYLKEQEKLKAEEALKEKEKQLLRSANPAIPATNGIVLTPNPPLVGDVTTIFVRTRNDGGSAALGVEVTLSVEEWGLGFQTWREIGTAEAWRVEVDDEVLVSFTHVFESREQISLKAEITNVMKGGNSVTADDVALISLSVFHVGPKENGTAFQIPVRNGGEKEILVPAFDVFCFNFHTLTEEDLPFPIGWGGTGAGTPVANQKEDMREQSVQEEKSKVAEEYAQQPKAEESEYKKIDVAEMKEAVEKTVDLADKEKKVESKLQEGQIKAFQGYLARGEGGACPFETGVFNEKGEEVTDLRLLPGEEVLVEVQAKGLYDGDATPIIAGGAFVGIRAVDRHSGADSHAMTILKPTTVEELLNAPLLCCFAKVRTRVQLGQKLVLALLAYQAGEVADAINMLRSVAEEALQVGCDAAAQEPGCSERLLLMLPAIARLMAKGLGPPAVDDEATGARRELKALLEFQIPEKVVMEKDGDFYGRMGQPGAAIAKYERAARFYKKRKYNEEVLEQRKAELSRTTHSHPSLVTNQALRVDNRQIDDLINNIGGRIRF